MDAQFLYELIRLVGEADLAEVQFESGDVKLKIVKRHAHPESSAPILPASPTPVPVSAPLPSVVVPPALSVPPPSAAAPAPAKAAPSAANIVVVKSPMIGTFYRAPGPDKPPFVNVGDLVHKGTVLCIIEAMKLFNEIESDVEGRIVKILVENAKPVEFEQPLFEIDTAV
ncbi:MAG: acetyl-CoA carboxylase biotin carboxyl carrier protein [Bacteroidia bacterium]|nr:acetyl-CoA carboxylase biotin carboxyl carrier protein [Bacteroidia bacterium]